MVRTRIRTHIEEVISSDLNTGRAVLTVPQPMLRYYMLELKLMGISVEVDENKLRIDWTERAKQSELNKRNGAEIKLKQAAKLMEDK